MPHLDAQEIKGGLDLMADGLGKVQVAAGYVATECSREHHGKDYAGRHKYASGDGEQGDKPSLEAPAFWGNMRHLSSHVSSR